MKVYDAMANAFIKEGTSVLFGLLGDGQMTWWSAMAKYPQLQIIDVRDEGCAVTMAEGYAMATGKVGVASATQGPGLTRMTTSLIVAARSHTPTTPPPGLAPQIAQISASAKYTDVAEAKNSRGVSGLRPGEARPTELNGIDESESDVSL